MVKHYWYSNDVRIRTLRTPVRRKYVCPNRATCIVVRLCTCFALLVPKSDTYSAYADLGGEAPNLFDVR